MPPVLATAVTIAAAIVVVSVLRREWQRVNRELDAVPVRVKDSHTLRRDPVTGEWRPHR
jgi:uncharacterized lipoprotein